MRRLKPHQRVSLDVAKRRALAALSFNDPVPASLVAGHIWPDHDLTAQGAGGAASRVLQDEGSARWSHDPVSGRWGWMSTDYRSVL